MSQMYYHIATVSCKHLYYKGGFFRSLNFSMEEDSIKLMNDLGIVLKQFLGGFHLLSASPELLASEENENSLKFYLNCSDPYYINFTDLIDYSPVKDVLYFNNLSAQNIPDEKAYSLHNTEFVSMDNVLQLSHGNIESPLFDKAKTYTFHEASNEELPIESVQKSVLNNSSSYTITDLPQGLINIKFENKVIHRVYYCPNVVWKKPLGIIELFTGTLYQDFKVNEKANYIINYNNRSTYWKYFLTGSAYQNYDALSIINKEKESIFNNPQKQKIQDNTDALVFTSANKLPLLEYTDDAFQLVSNYNSELGFGKVIIKNLVRPSPEQLHIEPPNKKLDYSHIYIY